MYQTLCWELRRNRDSHTLESFSIVWKIDTQMIMMEQCCDMIETHTEHREVHTVLWNSIFYKTPGRLCFSLVKNGRMLGTPALIRLSQEKSIAFFYDVHRVYNLQQQIFHYYN